MANVTRKYEEQILAYLDRLARAKRRLENAVAFQHGLNALQLQVLLALHGAGHRKLTVSFLADELEVSEPTLSDSLRSLEKKRLIAKKITVTDRRIRQLQLTTAGEKIVEQCAREIRLPLSGLSAVLLQRLSSDLHTVVAELFSSGFLHHARVCKTCQYFSSTDQRFGQCDLLKKKLNIEDLQFDCSDHVYIQAPAVS